MTEHVVPESQVPEHRVERVSALAVGSFICGLAFCCPLFSLLGPVMGVIALNQIKRDPSRWGRGFAIAGIILGILSTALFFIISGLLNANVRQRVLHGPEFALTEAMAGQYEGFRSQLTGEAEEASNELVAEFVDTLRDRYGMLLSVTVDDERELDPERVITNRGRLVPYLFEFERQTLEGEARSEFHWTRLELRFTEIILRDPAMGDIAFPPGILAGSEADDADTGERIDPESSDSELGPGEDGPDADLEPDGS